MKKIRVKILKIVDVDNIPYNFWKLDTHERKIILTEAMDGTVIKASEFVKTAVINDYLEPKN